MKIRQDGGAQDDESLFDRILSRLDIAVLESGAHADAFHLRGVPPNWWEGWLGPMNSDVFCPSQCSPFLQDYLSGACPAWESQGDLVGTSGPWTEIDSQGGTMTLEAMTLSIGRRKILLIERLGPDFEHMRRVIQRARERMLAEDLAAKSHRATETRLTRQLEASEHVKDDLLALLQHFELAALIVDEHGLITFASVRGLELLGVGSEDLIGRSWAHVLPLSSNDRTTVQAMIAMQTGDSRTVSLRVSGPPARWIEMDVRADPCHSGRRILVLRDHTEVHELRRLLEEQATFHDLVGKSSAMLRTYQLVRDVAQVDTTVLIEGETGTGKELIARAVHFSSGRKHKPFIAANCAGLTDSLLTSQLFGHRRGAFTGAVSDQQGLFEAAEGGTLFLDEIGDIPPQIQMALLRALQEKEITRLGETRPRKVDVRVVAATHHNLSADVAHGTFRADLLYRIRIARIPLPPLRDRRDDIPLLAQAFLSQIRTTTGKAIARMSPDCLRLLLSYSWPGNVRELKSAVEFAAISCKGTEVLPDDLPPEITGTVAATKLPVWIPLTNQDEKSRFLAALSDAKGNRTEAAKQLGISRATLYRRLADLNIDPRL